MAGNIKETIEISSSSIEDMDYSVRAWLEEELNIHTMTNRGWKKVPILWVAGERVHQSKRDSRLRDSSGALILPLITVERTSVAKDPAQKGTAWANIPNVNDKKGGALVIARRINQKKTSQFTNADSARQNGKVNFRTRKQGKTVYQTISIPMPVYVDVGYKITLRTEYQQQMNEMVQPFITEPGGRNYLILSHNKHRYEAWIGQDFSQDNTVADMGEGERNYQTSIEVKVLGAIIGDGPNEETPRIVIRENAVEVKIARERVILQDEAEHTDDKKYKGTESFDDGK
jgi:hypothetical protein